MNKERIVINHINIDLYSLNTVVVGTGAAGYNAADSLYDLGQKDIAIITEGIQSGTSRNTGSDKQTYYKLTLSGDTPDSVYEMAQTLFKGGSMHGDIALVEAALSAKGFYKLVSIGVPFPHNRYGEYIGYKTDHDPRERATSAGPLTSRFMTEKLEMQVKSKGIKVFDGMVVIAILTRDGQAIGLLAVDARKQGEENYGFTLFNYTNVIYATGGPAGIYLTSVYPEGHTGMSGIAFEAGALGINLTESQYGIASIKFRWNLSGTYQQVIPRYISTDSNGNNKREFLDEYIQDRGKMLDAIFLKGYQWPFDPKKIEHFGSSLVDVLVYCEIQIKGRRVFLDFQNNPSRSLKDGEFDWSLLGSEARSYLANSGALFGRPIDRLARMNQPAIDLYLSNGIDLSKEPLEIAVCAQHNNGGLRGNLWYESNLLHLFPVGEVNGVFGVYRPGGSALNSTQVGSLRAAQYIAAHYAEKPMDPDSFIKTVKDTVLSNLDRAKVFLSGSEPSTIIQNRLKMQSRMTRSGAHIRALEDVEKDLEACFTDLRNFEDATRVSSPSELVEAFKNRDILLTQIAYLSAIREYIRKGGQSRGSYLVRDDQGILPAENLPASFRFSLDKGALLDKALVVGLNVDGDQVKVHTKWEQIRPIPREDNWFETVWSQYRRKEIIK